MGSSTALSPSFLSLLTQSGSIAPTFAPSQTQLNTFSYANQQLQYFAQGQSNPPGQTVDLVLRNFTALVSLLTSATQRNDVSATTKVYLGATIAIVNACVEGILEKFSSPQHMTWFSAILPNKGYASNNAINTVFAQANLGTLNQTGISSDYLIRLAYVKLYAQMRDLQNATLQINRYTYHFMATAQVTASELYTVPPAPASVTKTVTEWFEYIENQWSTSGSPVWSSLEPFESTSTNSFWTSHTIMNLTGTSDFLQYILDNIGTNAVVLESITPVAYKAAPTDNLNGNQVTAEQEGFFVFFYTVLAILLGKQLRALSIGLAKLSRLVDTDGTAVFSSTYSSVQDAVANYLPALEAFLINSSLQGIKNGPTTTTTVGPFLDTQGLAACNSIAALDTRNASADPNRIPGSLRPTIDFQRKIVDILIHLYNDPAFQSPSPYPSILQNNTDDFATKLAALNTTLSSVVLPDLNDAWDSLATQADIHYGRWPFNMSNI